MWFGGRIGDSVSEYYTRIIIVLAIQKHMGNKKPDAKVELALK